MLNADSKKYKIEIIAKEFQGGMENIRNNFYLSFLTLLALESRPFDNSISIPSYEEPGFIDYNSLNKIGQDSVIEFENSIRRHTLNDIVICYERHASQLYLVLKDNEFSDPSMEKSICNYPIELETKFDLYTQDECTFFSQLRRLRNSIVHYNGVYNKKNTLNYKFQYNYYNSKGHEGENIMIKFETIMFIYHKVLDLFMAVCDRSVNKAL